MIDKKMVLETIEKRFQESYPGYKLIYLSVSGSELHGTATENSDSDYKGIFVPSMDSLILGKNVKTISIVTNKSGKNTSEDVDISLYSLHALLELISKNGDSNAYEILFSMGTPGAIYMTEEAEILLKDRDLFICNNILGFTGMAIKKMSEYSIRGERYSALEEFVEFLNNIFSSLSRKDLRQKKFGDFRKEIQDYVKGKEDFFKEVEKEDGTYLSVLGKLYGYSSPVGYVKNSLMNRLNQYGSRAKASKEGHSFKAMSHALRVILEAKELLTEGRISYPSKKAKLLKNIKEGKEDPEKIINMIEKEFSELEEISEKTSLPKHPERKNVEKALLTITKMAWDVA